MTESLDSLRAALILADAHHRHAVAAHANAKKFMDVAAMAHATASANIEAYRKKRHEELDREMDGT